MPIPTRSLSLREPQGRKQAVNGDSRSSSPTKQSQLPLSNRGSILRRPTTSSEAQGDSGIGLGIANGHGNGHGNNITNGIQEKKSLLPQRRTIPRPQSVQIPQSTVQKARLRQTSESRPELKKPSKPAPSQTEDVKGRPSSSRSRSPTKPEPKRVIARPLNAAPLARPVRSSSLLHPAAPKLVGPPSHARHRSQVINFDSANANPRPATSGGRPASYHPSISKPPGTLPTYQARFGLKKPAKSNIKSPETVLENPSPSPTPSEDQLPPAQTLALQTELLQLHVLHSQGLQTKAKWEANAEKHYRKLHESVKASYRREQEKHRHQNFQAVKKFEEKSASSKSGHNFAIQMGILSRVIQEVTHLTESKDGQYNTVIGMFEEWTQHVERLKQSRQLQGDDEGEEDSDKIILKVDDEGDLQFIEPLPPQWKEDVTALSLQLSQLAGNLDDLDIPKDTEMDKHGKEVDYSESALVKAVAGHKSLLESMAEELDMIHRVEMEVMEFEILWMERALESVGATAD